MIRSKRSGTQIQILGIDYGNVINLRKKWLLVEALKVARSRGAYLPVEIFGKVF